MTSHIHTNVTLANISNVEDAANVVDLMNFVKAVKINFAISRFVISPIIVIMNVLLITSILQKKELRIQFRYLAITSIAFSDLLIGAISCPIRADGLLHSTRNHGCILYLMLSVYEQYVQMFVGTWTLVLINSEIILKVYNFNCGTFVTLKYKLVTISVVCFPWIAMFFIVLPIAKSYASEYFSPIEFCRLIVPLKGKHIIISMTHIIPSLIIIIQIVFMAVWGRSKKNAGNEALQNDMASTNRSSTQDHGVYIAAAVVTLAMISLEQLLNMAMKEVLLSLHYKIFTLLYYSSVVVADAKSAVLPAVWLALPEIRNSLKQTLCCRRTRRVDAIETEVNSYQNLQEEAESRM